MERQQCIQPSQTYFHGEYLVVLLVIDIEDLTCLSYCKYSVVYYVRTFIEI